MSEELSTCCDAERYLETDLCSDCKEHADFETSYEQSDHTIYDEEPPEEDPDLSPPDSWGYDGPSGFGWN